MQYYGNEKRYRKNSKGFKIQGPTAVITKIGDLFFVGFTYCSFKTTVHNSTYVYIVRRRRGDLVCGQAGYRIDESGGQTNKVMEAGRQEEIGADRQGD